MVYGGAGERFMLSKVREAIDKAIREYNKYRSPEATAEVIGFSSEKLNIIFKGIFKNTCGFIDWIEDLKYILEKYGVITSIEKIVETYDGAIVLFRVKSINLKTKY